MLLRSTNVVESARYQLESTHHSCLWKSAAAFLPLFVRYLILHIQGTVQELHHKPDNDGE